MAEPRLDPPDCDLFCPACLSNLEDAFFLDAAKEYECTSCGHVFAESEALSKSEAREEAAYERAERRIDEQE